MHLEGLEAVDLNGKSGPWSNEYLDNQAKDYLSRADQADNGPVFPEDYQSELRESSEFVREQTSPMASETFETDGQKWHMQGVSYKFDELGVGAAGTGESMTPIWGSGRNMVNDYQNGRYLSGTVNGISAVSDVFMVKSLVVGATKGGISALSKNYKNWSSWRQFYGDKGFANAGQDVHHWLLEKGSKSGEGFGWWAKNQQWNLKPMESMTLGGVKYDGAIIHQAMHGNSRYLKLTTSQQIYTRMYQTPVWFKAGVGSAPGHINGIMNGN